MLARQLSADFYILRWLALRQISNSLSRKQWNDTGGFATTTKDDSSRDLASDTDPNGTELSF
jgi:hypothetical protein